MPTHPGEETPCRRLSATRSRLTCRSGGPSTADGGVGGHLDVGHRLPGRGDLRPRDLEHRSRPRAPAPHHDDRPGDPPLVASLPLERIVRSRHRELFFISWTTPDLLFIATCAALDGGAESPFALLFVLPFLFGALSYPIWATAARDVVSLSFAGIAVGVGGGFSYSGLRRLRPALRRDPRRLGGAQPGPPAGAADRHRRGAARSEEPSRLRPTSSARSRASASSPSGAPRSRPPEEAVEICGGSSTLTSPPCSGPCATSRARGRRTARDPRGGEHDRKPPLRHRVPGRLHARDRRPAIVPTGGARRASGSRRRSRSTGS